MTDTRRMIVDLAALVSTLRGESWVPASAVYLAFGSDLGRYEAVVGAAVRMGWAERTSERVRLTPLGEEKAALVDVALRAAEEKKKH